MRIAWDDIKKSIDTLVAVDGGFSSAHRGIVTLPDGTKIFVKIGTDEPTKKWAAKEVETYRFLQRQEYPFIPDLFAWSPDKTGFALEPLMHPHGWNWADEWTEARVDKTLAAMDALAAITPVGAEKNFFSIGAIDATSDGWGPLRDSNELQETLVRKLRAIGTNKIADNLNVSQQAERSARFIFSQDVLVHHDVRADNCPWNAAQQAVKLVDWNWTQLGDRRIDFASTLVHIHKSGLDVTQKYAGRLDADALHWMAGFWFRAAATPIWEGGPGHLRDFQLQSGATALQLAARL